MQQNREQQTFLVGIAITAMFIFITMIIALLYGFYYGDFYDEGVKLMNMPWGLISIIDVYAGILLFSIWLFWREPNLLQRGLWFLTFVCLGNLATSAYVLKNLIQANGDFNQFINGKNEG